MKNLKFMNSINSTTLDYNPATDDEWLHLHKERIKIFYISLMTTVIIHNDSQGVNVNITPPAEIDIPAAAKRQRAVEVRDIQAASKKRVLAMKRNSYMDVDSDGDEEAELEVPVLSPLQRATIEFNHCMTKKTASALQIPLTRPEGLVNFWQNTGKNACHAGHSTASSPVERRSTQPS